MNLGVDRSGLTVTGIVDVETWSNMFPGEPQPASEVAGRPAAGTVHGRRPEHSKDPSIRRKASLG